MADETTETEEETQGDQPMTREEMVDLVRSMTQPSEDEVEEQKDEEASKRGGDGTNVEVRGDDSGRDTIRVNGQAGRETREWMAHNTLQMFLGHTANNAQKVGEAARNLFEAGHYERGYTDDGRSIRDEFQNARAAGDFYSTVVSADGGLLLPTTVRDEIEELADQVGVAREVCQTFSQVIGDITVPGATGVESSADFVAEGGEITSAKRAFQSVNLNPKKVAQIVPWSYEAQVELAPQILEDVQRAISRSFARAEDDALLNGDGTSSFNSIDGIFSSNRSSVGQLTIGSTGSDDPADIGPDELVLARNKIDPGARANDQLFYIFHPDLEAVFLTKKDDNNQYLFDYVERDGVAELKGIPVLYTEVLPGTGSSQNTDFGALVNGSFLKMALGEGMTSEELTQGVIKDADTGSNINLSTQDLRALKVREFFDIDFNFESACMKFTTNSTS